MVETTQQHRRQLANLITNLTLALAIALALVLALVLTLALTLRLDAGVVDVAWPEPGHAAGAGPTAPRPVECAAQEASRRLPSMEVCPVAAAIQGRGRGYVQA